jgi:hypothetical protein
MPRDNTILNSEEQELRRKLEHFKSSKIPKSILKLGGNAPVASFVFKKCDVADAATNAPLRAAAQPSACSAHTAANHVQVILHKVTTDANSLANEGRLSEVRQQACGTSGMRALTLVKAVAAVDSILNSDLAAEVKPSQQQALMQAIHNSNIRSSRTHCCGSRKPSF